MMLFTEIFNFLNNGLILALLFTILVLVIAYTFWKNYDLPPGPWGLPIFGYLPWLDPKNPYLTLTNIAKKYGKICSLNLGSVYTVVLTDPKVIKTVFSKDSTTGRAPLYLTHGIMNGYGLICAQGDLWKEHRRFTFNCLRQFGATKIGAQRKRMESLILEHCSDLTEHLETKGKNVDIDLVPELLHSLGSVVSVITFGKCWNRDDELWKWFQHQQEEGPKYLGVAGPLNFLPFFRFFPKYQRIMDFVMEGKIKTHEHYQTIIKEQALVLDKLNIQHGDANNLIHAFILEKQKKSPEIAETLYNDSQFNHMLGDMFGAALDTTVTTLRWYFLYIAKYPSIQEEIQKELKEVLENRSPTMEDISHLPLLESSLLEIMRIRPVVPVGIPHGTLEDIEIEGYRVPKGTMLVPLLWALHMDESVWKNPSEYNPKRFINEEGKIEKPEHFMPFQIGKRMCVGEELAKMFLFLFAATFLQKFSIVLTDKNVDLWGECGITLTPKDHQIRITKINKVA